MTFTEPTQAASAPQSLGQIKSQEASAAARAAGRAPITGMSLPSRESSPNATCRDTSSLGMTSMAASKDKAIGRSKCDPSLGRSAGDRFTVMRFEGSAKAIEVRAARTRSLASDTALSGRPTMLILYSIKYK